MRSSATVVRSLAQMLLLHVGLEIHCTDCGCRISVRNKTRMRVIAASPSAKVKSYPKHDFEHFRSSEQHADGTKRLARYDFPLVFYSDLRSWWNCCRVTSR